MRVCKCPDCGKIIVDNPLWRPSGFKWGVDFTSFENFELIDSELARKLKLDGQWTEDELYLYRLSRNGNVSRMAKLEYTKETFLLHGLTDSAAHKNPFPKKFHFEKLKKQRQLLEERAPSVTATHKEVP
ncbi:MAG: hypothetical protein ABSF44_10465 [Candidatus Bathyarchaeia archaeon]|jgi:hypothetical protein